jgi:hypothetical protein
LLPEHFSSDGRPLASGSQLGVYLACDSSWALAQLVPASRKFGRQLDAGTNLHACVNYRIFQGEAVEGEAPDFDAATQEAADAIFWRLKSIASPLLFSGGIPRIGEHRLTDGIVTASPDLAWMESNLLRIVDLKRSGWDTMLPSAADSPQLLAQAGLLLREWAPAQQASLVQVGYVTPDKEDMADPVPAFEIVARFSQMEEKFLAPPVLKYTVGPHCARCNYSSVCPKVGAERLFGDVQVMSHAELAEMYRDSAARAKAAEARLEEADRELMKRLEEGAAPEDVGFKIRRDPMYSMPDPVGFLRKHGIAIESCVKSLSLATARKLLAEMLDRGLTEEEIEGLERESTKKLKSPFLQPIKTKNTH